ncbi:MAG: PepSY domain-containing protein [Gemmatimonadetes bacterium]|nr:PepSY domain-containing protein [Gemmatimonadota bacterium]
MMTKPLSHGLALEGARALAFGLVLALGACSVQRGGETRAARQDSSRSPAVDSTGVNQQLVLASAKIALPPPGVRPENLPEPASEGAQALVTFCTACHNLAPPTIHSATDWPAVVRRMWLRMDRLPPEFGVPLPTVQQRQAILNYLIKDALVVSGQALPAGAGRSTFSKACSQCHALPDPRQHSPVDWPMVIARMQQRMDQMKVDQPPKAAVQEIRAYLDEVTTTRFRADSARKLALAKVPNGKIVEQHFRQEDGRVIYSFFLRVPGRPGTDQVDIDAKTGVVFGVKHDEPVARP